MGHVHVAGYPDLPAGRVTGALSATQRWSLLHPRLVDGGLVAVTVAFSTAALLVRREDRLAAPAVVLGLIVASAAALVVRRERPVLAWAGATVAGLLAVLLSAEGPALGLATTIGLYAVGRRASLSATVLATLASGVAYTVAVAAAGNAWLDDDGDIAGLQLLAWGGAAAAIGVSVRSHRRALDAAEERALQAEQTREEEAERRVTDERLRIARDLHDVVAHHISVVNVQAGVARHLLETDPDQARAALGLVRDASKTVLTELSAVVGLLRSPDEGDAPREPAPGMDRLAALVESVRRAGLDLTTTVAGQVDDLPPISDLTAYRVVQEALTNALKYGTGTARLTLDHRPEELRITVRNPIGAAGGAADGTGHGLIGMRERVEAVSGRLWVGPGPDASFTVSAAIPRAGERAGHERAGHQRAGMSGPA